MSSFLRSHWFNGGRLLIWVVLLLGVLSLPFLALITIDLFGLWTSENSQHKQRREHALIDTLVDRIGRTDEWNDSSTDRMDMLSLRPACNRLHLSEIEFIRPTIGKELPSANLAESIELQLVINDSMLQNMALVRSYQRARAGRTLTPLQASALHACIAVTPFSRWCTKEYHQAIKATELKFEDGLLHLGLIKKIEGAKVGDAQYCSTVPELRIIDQQRP